MLYGGIYGVVDLILNGFFWGLVGCYGVVLLKRYFNVILVVCYVKFDML